MALQARSPHRPISDVSRLQRLRFRGSSGVSLVELMIAMALGLLIVLTIGYAYVGSRQAFRGMDALSRMQENARFVFETMTLDLRMAGFVGCPSTKLINVLNNSTDWEKNLYWQPLLGYEAGSGIPAVITTALANRDAITVLRADTNEYIVASHTPPSAQLQLAATHDIKQGELLVVCDNTQSTLFQMTNVNNNNTIDVIVHNTGAGSPGNYTKGFGIPSGASSPFNPWASCEDNPASAWCGDTNGTAYTFAPGSRIHRLKAHTYFVANNSNGEPTLHRQSLGHGGGNATSNADEVAEGVEDMQITYGVDTSVTADRSADAYLTADNVTDWNRVVSVRVSLLMVTRQNERLTTTAQTYTFNGGSATASDNRLRKVFTTVIALRNRL